MKAGFVVILGRSNVGKSTLLNALAGAKIAAVADKPQTTREAIQGVVTRPEGQIVFVDCPGVHDPAMELGRHMMREVRRATAGCHLALLVVDSTARLHKHDEAAIEIVRGLRLPALACLNKIDALKAKHALLPAIDRLREMQDFAEYVPLSARTGENVDLLLNLIFERLPEAPPYYPEDFITDQPERFLAAELIRERVIENTEREVPHSIAVLIEKWEATPRLLRIAAVIYVERDGQKKITIGAGGQKIKQIGTEAREQIESFFGSKVFLELFVKVRPGWRDNPSFVRSLDFRQLVGQEDTAEYETPETIPGA